MKNIKIEFLYRITILILILIGFVTGVNAVIPVTYSCCVNYSNSDGNQMNNFEYVPMGGIQLENFFKIDSLGGSQIDGFENVSSWIVSGGVRQADIVNHLEGDQGIKIISDGANASTSNNSSRTVIEKIINNNFANTSNFGIQVYIPDTTNLSYLRLYFTSTGTIWRTSFSYIASKKYSGLKNGWNKLIFNKNSFENTTYLDNWNNTMNRVRIAVYPELNDTKVTKNVNVTVDDLRFNVTNDWIVGGNYSYKEEDIVNETKNGLKLIATNGNRASIEKVVNYNFTNSSKFGILLYVNNSTFNTFQLFLTSTDTKTWDKYFMFDNWLGLKNGWNKLVFDKSDFINNNNESWNNTLKRVKITILPNENLDTNVTLADFKFDVNNDWLPEGKGYIQNDTVNSREGSQGLKLISSNNTYGVYAENTINKDFSNENNIVIWTYVDDASKLNYIRLSISSTAFHNSLFYKYIYQNYSVKSGWNKLIFDKHDFQNVGEENWNNIMNKIRLNIGPREDSISTWVTFDDLRDNIT